MYTDMSPLLYKDAIPRIAKAYSFADDQLPLIKEWDIHNFRRLINRQFADLSHNVYFDFVDYDPYPYVSIAELTEDWRNRTIKVNTSGNDSKLWGKVCNLQFRAIHDYIHCLHELDFNYLKEVEAFQKQINFSMQDKYTTLYPYMNWEIYYRVLRSEIVYQAAVKEHYEEFHINQKIIVLDL